MLTIQETHEKFMQKVSSHKYVKMHYNQYYGDLLTHALLCESKYDCTRGIQLNTFITACLNKKFCTLIKQDKKFYDRHLISSDFNNYKTQDDVFSTVSANEIIELIQKSNLTKRSKEVTILCLKNPKEPQAEIARWLGISREAVRLHVQSARKFLKEKGLEI